MKTLTNSSISEIKEKYKITNYKFVENTHTGYNTKIDDVKLPTGKPFQKVSPEESLKLIEQSKLNKVKKMVASGKLKESIMFKKVCKNIECRKEFKTTCRSKVYCKPECRAIGVTLKDGYFE